MKVLVPICFAFALLAALSARAQEIPPIAPVAKSASLEIKNAKVHLGVYEVYSVWSGDLSLPGTMSK